jgi:hypothetical protein
MRCPLLRFLPSREPCRTEMTSHVMLSLDIEFTEAPTLTRHWGSLKGEVIYDNTQKTRSQYLFRNQVQGIRGILQADHGKKSDMFVVGIDFRHYIRIHRELIWANRFAASSSFGPQNSFITSEELTTGWDICSTSTICSTSRCRSPRSELRIPGAGNKHEGFTQNIRNGNNFALSTVRSDGPLSGILPDIR